MEEKLIFFETADDFRIWLKKNYQSEMELWVGFYKKGTGRTSITWPESVDQALCFGWVDGLRKKIDEESYKIRFTPRKPKSHWSNVNINKVDELKRAGLMTEAGLEAFNRRDEANSGRASFEQKEVEFTDDLEKIFKSNLKAWTNFRNMPQGYRKQCTWYIIQAKREDTRLRRLNTVIECSEKGVKIPPFRRPGE